MKKVLMLLVTLLFSFQAANAEYVNGYYRNNGTYVNGYERNSGSSYNNSYGNINANPQRVQVDGYTRSNGTYVNPYERTAPNNVKYDNLNYMGN